MAADPEAAAQAAAEGRSVPLLRRNLVPRFHMLLTTFELAIKVRAVLLAE